jgi:hypothetical protein
MDNPESHPHFVNLSIGLEVFKDFHTVAHLSGYNPLTNVKLLEEHPNLFELAGPLCGPTKLSTIFLQHVDLLRYNQIQYRMQAAAYSDSFSTYTLPLSALSGSVFYHSFTDFQLLCELFPQECRHFAKLASYNIQSHNIHLPGDYVTMLTPGQRYILNRSV